MMFEEQASQNDPTETRKVSEEEKALVKKWQERIEAGLKRFETEFKRFDKNRKLIAGKVTGEADKSPRANLHFANMAAMLPQIYAKDPEFTVKPGEAVSPERLKAVKAFAATGEKLLTKLVVKDARLKRQSKKMLRSTFTTSIGWWKASWQEDRRKDPLIVDRLQDTQDNIDRIKAKLAEVNDPATAADHTAKLAELNEMVKGLETQQEVVVARGMVLDFALSEDVIVLDDSVRTVTDYLQSSALAHRVWMTPQAYEAQFGYKPKKAKLYVEKNGKMTEGSSDKRTSLICVFEVWDKDSNRIYLVCEGEEGFCAEPKSPDWTGRRWYPFFLCAFNEIDGSFYPLSDIELAEKLVEEYNQNREDFVRDREAALPVNIAREGGSLTEADAKRISNRKGSDFIFVSGVPGAKLTDDIYIGTLANLNPAAYDTNPARQDMEMVLGGGDAARGTVMKAKTATEAEILSQGLRGRSAERQDTMEDVLNELGPYALEMFLRKMAPEEVESIAGPGSAATWPQLSIDEIFNLVSVEVRGGSTGKPDRLQEQDRWIKLLPMIEKAMQTVAQLREQGQTQLADATVELMRETLRRFDERLDIEEFMPQPPKGEDDPEAMRQKLMQLEAALQKATKEAQDAREQVEKGYVSAAAQIATAADPLMAAQAFAMAMKAVDADFMGTEAPPQAEGMVPPDQQVMSPEDAPQTTTAPMLQ
jgi:hypothetical protein